MNKNDIKNELILKYSRIINMIQFSQIRYFHLRSINNFIYHIEKLKDESTYFFVAEKIDLYLDLVNKLVFVDKEQSLELFNEYISPIGKFFVKEANFRGYLSYKTIAFWLIIMNIVVFILFQFSFTLVYVVLNMIFLFVVIDVIKKMLNKKVYSFMY